MAIHIVSLFRRHMMVVESLIDIVGNHMELYNANINRFLTNICRILQISILVSSFVLYVINLRLLLFKRVL